MTRVLAVAVVLASGLAAAEDAKVVRKGELTCIQSVDDKGAAVEQCRKEGGPYVQYPRNVRKGDQLCTLTLDDKGQEREACVTRPPDPEQTRAPLGEYPRVIRRGGQVCVQTLDAKSQVVEECRQGDREYSGDTKVLTPRFDRDPTVSAAKARSATLLENSDPGAGRRMVVEGLAAVLVSPLPLGILGAACAQTGCGPGAVVVAVGSTALLMGLAAGVAHLVMDGQAGVGWGLIGSSIGIGTAALLIIAANAIGGAGYGAIVLYALAGIVPVVATVIALEVRDTQLRYGPPQEEEKSSLRLPPVGRGGIAVRF